METNTSPKGVGARPQVGPQGRHWGPKGIHVSCSSWGMTWSWNEEVSSFRNECTMYRATQLEWYIHLAFFFALVSWEEQHGASLEYGIYGIFYWEYLSCFSGGQTNLNQQWRFWQGQFWRKWTFQQERHRQGFLVKPWFHLFGWFMNRHIYSAGIRWAAKRKQGKHDVFPPQSLLWYCWGLVVYSKANWKDIQRGQCVRFVEEDEGFASMDPGVPGSATLASLKGKVDPWKKHRELQKHLEDWLDDWIPHRLAGRTWVYEDVLTHIYNLY